MEQNVEESPTLIKQFTRRTAPQYASLRIFSTNGKVEMSKSLLCRIMQSTWEDVQEGAHLCKTN